MLSNMLFARTEGNKVHTDVLLLLFMGVGPIIGNGDAEQFESYRYNLGIRFAEAICAIKSAQTSTKTGPRVERIGSLLTTLFRYLKVDLSDAHCVEEMSRLDMQHLVFSKIISKNGTYRFSSATGADHFIELPKPSVVQLSTMEDLAFQPAPEHLAPTPHRPSSSARPSTCSRRSAPRPSTCSPGNIGSQGPSIPRPLFRDDATSREFDLPPISDNAESVEYRRWMI